MYSDNIYNMIFYIKTIKLHIILFFFTFLLFSCGRINFEHLSNLDSDIDIPLDSSTTSTDTGTTSTDTGTAPSDTDIEYPVSCADIIKNNSLSPDGEYKLYISSNPKKIWTAYCYDMAGTPKEYLSLQYTGGDSNFSQYTAGGSSSGTDVRTNYTKIRIDPNSLKVDVGDQTFASSNNNSLIHGHSGGDIVTSMTYGTAMSCVDNTPDNDYGIANIDLRDTPFKMNKDNLHSGGFDNKATAVIDSSQQVVSITGGGFCGWNSLSSLSNPYNFNGGFDLQLFYIESP